MTRESHGMSGTRTYRIWKAMRTRCNNPNFHAYPRYGGRGVRVCAEWDSFATFYADMGEAPTGKSLDRVDNDGDYMKGNCRWATNTEQGRNMRSNRYVTHRGETLCLVEWAERLGTTSDVLWKRLDRHGSLWSLCARPTPMYLSGLWCGCEGRGLREGDA